ncbi:MAG TPA: ABC transporter permease [Vicinamibacteria bacterium]
MDARGAAIVFSKEVVDNFRDRRTLVAALLYPLLGPGLILLMIFAIGRLSKDAEQPLRLPVSGSEHAPSLISFLRQNRVELLPASGDAEAAVRSRRELLVLVIPAEFPAQFREGQPAVVRLVFDPSRNEALSSIQRAQALLEGYGRQIGQLRLQARGIDPRVLDALSVENVDVSTSQSQGARMLAVAPYLIITALFVGGMYLAIDSTAGERERGSLEPLLINPLGRGELVLGKAAAVLLFTLVALLETLAGFAFVLNLVPLERFIGVQMSLPPAALGTILLTSLPLMVFVVALQMMVASYTTSFKEAQNYVSVMLLLPALPALLMAVLPMRESLWIALLPTVGQQVFMNQILRGEAVNPSHLLASSLLTLGAGVLLFALVIRRYSREDILFR